MGELKLLVSLHDVAPRHVDRLQRAERLLTSAGVDRVAYLLVPNFHGTEDVGSNPDFTRWCRQPRPFEIEWLLHGCFHCVVPPVRAQRISSWIKSSVLTAGEGEFLSLEPRDARERLLNGHRAFSACLGMVPIGFVPPAWLMNRDELFPVLTQLGFQFTEDHHAIYQLQTGRRVSCPAITWATRTRARRYGSRIVCPALLHRWRRLPSIRIALHPMDFDHTATVASIERVLAAAMRGRHVARYDELFETPRFPTTTSSA